MQQQELEKERVIITPKKERVIITPKKERVIITPKIEKAVQEKPNCLDKHQPEEKDEFDTKQKEYMEWYDDAKENTK
eukprot:11036539-Heterocapsa_arctica.AAC.1